MFYTLFHQIPLPPAKERYLANFCKGFLRYILVKIVEPNPTGRFKRTFKLSKPDLDLVTGFMDTVWSQMYGDERRIVPEEGFKDVWWLTLSVLYVIAVAKEHGVNMC